MGDKMEGVVPLGVGDVWVGAVGDEELDDIEVAIACCPLHRRCDEVAAECINLSALLEEVFTSWHLCVMAAQCSG